MNSSSEKLIRIFLLGLFSILFISFSYLIVDHLSTSQEELAPADLIIPTPTKQISTVNIATDTSVVIANNNSQEDDQDQFADFVDIPRGVYLLYEEWKRDRSIMGINLDTGEEVYFSDTDSWCAFELTGELVAYINYDINLVIHNLKTKEDEEIPLGFHRCSDMTWSPDGNDVAINCEDRVYVVSVDDMKLHLLTTWTHPSVHSYWNPTWSPDGKWIATSFRQLSSLNTTEYDGIYLLDTSCITQPSSCEEKMVGPFFPYSHHVWFAWSPSSDYITAYVDYSLKQVNIETNDVITLIDETSDIYGLIWSPDGEWIYYSQETDRLKVDIFKIPTHGGDPILIAEDKGRVITILDIE